MRTNVKEGDVFGLLKIIEILETEKTLLKDDRTQYDNVLKCVCECGKIVKRKKRYLEQGNRMSCDSLNCKKKIREFKLCTDKVIFEAPLCKNMEQLARMFNVNRSLLKYRLMKANKLLLVKNIIRINKND